MFWNDGGGGSKGNDLSCVIYFKQYVKLKLSPAPSGGLGDTFAYCLAVGAKTKDTKR